MTKILLVEDDKNLREIYGVRLLAEGYDIVSAGDGEEALAMAIKERPTLILSDVMMPKISGFDMLDILRSTTETKNIKVIIMTALSSDEQRARGESLGADRYLVKSQVGIEDVIRTVHEVLQDGITPFLAKDLSTPTQPSPSPMPSSSPTPPSAPSPVPSVSPPPVVNTPPRPVPNPNPAPVSAPSSPPPVTPPVQPSAPSMSTNLGIPPTPSPSTNPLPQTKPTIPTPKPSSTQGERVIHPLPPQNPNVDMGQLMNQELNNHTNGPSAPQPPIPPLM